MSEVHDLTEQQALEHAQGDEPASTPRLLATQRKVEKATKRQRAFALRRQGHSYEVIAAELGVNRNTVSIWVREAIRDIPQEEIDDLRAMELARLDELLRPMMKLAAKGDTFAVSQALRVMERRAKMLDLDQAGDRGLEQVGSLLDRLVNAD